MADFIPTKHFGFLTNRVGRLIGDMIEPILQENDCHLPHSCLGILAQLWQKDGLTQKELGKYLIKTKSTISNMLDGLIENDLIYKEINGEDKRNKKIFLTDKGKSLQKVVEQRSSEADSMLLKEFSCEEIDTSKRVLTILYQNLSEKLYNSK